MLDGLDGAVPPLPVRNPLALWEGLAAARGHTVLRRRSFLAVDAGDGPGGLRVIVRTGEPAAGDVDELDSLLAARRGPVVVEDPFGSLDLSDRILLARELPVMARQPAPVAGGDPAGVDVTRVTDRDMLAAAERIMVDGFPMDVFQPYRPHTMLPPALLERDGFDVFLARRGGTPAGACMTVDDPRGGGGVYWVATLPEHRSRGVARALMHAALHRLDNGPVSLVATAAGEPLYDSLGFETVAHTTWWRLP